MTDEMVAWIREQLDDDEAYALNAFGDHNQAESEWTEIWSGAVQVGPNEDLLLTGDSQVSRHIARFDPARELRQVEATRHLVEQADREGRAIRTATLDGGFFDHILRVLALPYSDRPGYRKEWRP